MENILDMVLKGNDAVVAKSWKTTPDGGDPKTDFVKVGGKVSFEGLTIRQIMDLATKPVIIKRQGVERSMAEIPTQVTIHATSAGQKPQDVNTVVDNMSEEYAKAALAKIKAKFGDLV